MPQNIFTLFVARTGSSYLMQLIDCFKDVKVLCDYGEIFTIPEAVLRTFDGDKKLGILSEEYKEFALNNPYKYLKFINNSVPDKYICSKIQIPYLLNQQNNVKNSIVNFNNAKFIIVKRNLIDAYISNKKAYIVNKWSKVDTTDIKLDIDIQNFKNYCNRMKKMYSDMFKLLKGKDYVIFDYDELQGFATGKSKLELISSKLKEMNINLDIDYNILGKQDFLFKQDKVTHHIDKINNYYDFEKAVKELELDHLLK